MEAAYRLDILEMAAERAAECQFDAATILLARFFECTPQWRHPTQTTGKEREIWEGIVNVTNFWRLRLAQQGEDVEAMSPEALSLYHTRIQNFLRWRRMIFKEQEK